jgi:rare lipoprotein A
MRPFVYPKIMKGLLVIVLILVVSFPPTTVRSDANVFYLEGVASWYAGFSPGVRPTTANMERFDHEKLTCAIWDIPFDTVLEVTNLSNGRKVRVRVNDRGPAMRLREEGRVIDLSMRAFREIEDLEKGLTRVSVRVVELPFIFNALKNNLFFTAFVIIISCDFVREYLNGIYGIKFEKYHLADLISVTGAGVIVVRDSFDLKNVIATVHRM